MAKLLAAQPSTASSNPSPSSGESANFRFPCTTASKGRKGRLASFCTAVLEVRLHLPPAGSLRTIGKQHSHGIARAASARRSAPPACRPCSSGTGPTTRSAASPWKARPNSSRRITISRPCRASATTRPVAGHRPMRLVARQPWPHVWICASTICVRRLLVIEAEQLLRVVVQDLVGDCLRQAEALDIGKGLPVDLPILQHRIVAAGHDVIGAKRFEGA
jgi:hypothetical protein